ncbi:MAG TPA: putative phage tail protein [Lachnospiraceae bacterium]|nr:putative phage tail protein [Lachnospiraceae bacterium]
MAKEVDLLNYYPTALKEIREFKALAEVENPKTSCIWQAVEDAMKDQFANTLTDNGAKRWESIMRIQKKDTDDIGFRRFRIISRLNEQLPYSYRMLEFQLRNLCGENGFTLTLNNSNYTLYARVALTAKNKFNETETILKKYVPCNIVIDLSLLYNQYSQLEKYTYADLERCTYQALREEVLS